MAMLGLIGGPLICVQSTLVLFGAFDQTSSSAFPFAVPEVLWEASLGIYLWSRASRHRARATR
jgi:hypothetical protein